MDDLSPALLLLDLPPSALAGIDLLSFTTTPSFHGIKSLPPGVHFVFTAPHSTLAVRHGAWFHIPAAPTATAADAASPPPLVIKKWDPATETLRPETDAAEVLRRRANMGRIWKAGLAPYRQRAYTPSHPSRDSTGGQSSEAMYSDDDASPNSWTALSRHVSVSYLSRVLGQDADGWHVTSYSDTEGEIARLPAVRSVPGEYDTERPLALMGLDLRRTWREGATGRERTEAARDRSWYLCELGRRHGADAKSRGGDMVVTDGHGLEVVLAEMQFCFLMALTLNNYTCLEQWRTILRLVLTCRSAVQQAPDFFVEFLAVLQAQISRLGRDDAADFGGNEPSSRAMDHGKSNGTGKVSEVAAEMEDQTEEELLRYDLPLRNRDGASKSKKKQLADAARAMAEEAEDERAAAMSAVANDELKQLFLEDDADTAGGSFLRHLLIKFRAGIEDQRMASRKREGQGGGTATQDVLVALSALEATLFEQYGWDFDDIESSERAKSGLKKALPAMVSDEVDLEGYGIPTSRARGEATKAAVDDDDEDESGEYAPAVVELSQAEMDALGIQGTPSKHETSNEQRPQVANGMWRGDAGEANGISGVVVEGSSDDSGDEGPHGVDSNDSEESLDDTMDIEDMDARY